MTVKQFFKKQTFNPGIVGFFTNPFFFARRALYDAVEREAGQLSGKILDVGCGQKPYLSLFKYTEYIGMEVEQEGHDHTNEQVDVFFDGKVFPFENDHFDGVLTSQVLEHVFTPDEFLQEIHRVLRPDGRLLLTVPFVWDEHEQPYDYARYSSFGLRHLLEKNGFTILSHQKTLQDFRVIVQLINGYIFKKTYWAGRKSPMLNIVASVVFNAWLNILGVILWLILPKNKDLYLDNVIVATKK
jgi:SAM-dependent methyltransferase